MASRGRPKKDIAQNKVVQVRVTPEDKDLYERAASLATLSLSSWARSRLTGIAREELKKIGEEADNLH